MGKACWLHVLLVLYHLYLKVLSRQKTIQSQSVSKCMCVSVVLLLLILGRLLLVPFTVTVPGRGFGSVEVFSQQHKTQPPTRHTVVLVV